MSRVTSKLQVTLPKVIAAQFGIRPGDEIQWEPAGEVIRVIPPRRRVPTLDVETRLHLFDAATERQKRRQAGQRRRRAPRNRGWRREGLYTRGRAPSIPFCAGTFDGGIATPGGCGRLPAS
jgi:AbrB family looped-hinge helix DNA binding protein